MNDKKFDEILASKINAHDSPVPPDMFDRIKGEDKRRRMFGWWWIGAGIAALVTGIILFTTPMDDEPEREALTQKKAVREERKSQTDAVPVPENRSKPNDQRDKQRAPGVPQTPDNRPAISDEADREHSKEPPRDTVFQKQEELDWMLTAGRDDRYLEYDRNKKLRGYTALALADTTKPLKTTKQRSNKMFVEVHAGPAAAIRRAEELTAYPLTGPGDETRLAWHAGVMIGKMLGRKWSIKTGVYYTSIAWRDVPSASHDSSTYGARMFDVPVITGYQVNHGKVSININAGVLANIYTTYKGHTSDSLRGSYSLQNSGYLKKNVGLKVYAGIGAMYAVNKNLAVLIEPSLVYHLSDMSRDESSFRVKTHQAGIAAGIRYYFQ